MIEKVKEAIAKDSLVLFVGAGMSIPLGVPNWNNLVKTILKKLEEKYKQNSPLNFRYYIETMDSGSTDLFDILTRLEEEHYKSETEKILYEIIGKVSLEEKNLERHKNLWSISDKIITTNYDKALENVIPKGVHTFTQENVFQQKQSLSGTPFLYKIHGDISDPTKCVLFRSDYEKLYIEENSNTQSLRNFLLNKTILFVGFSLEDPFINKQIDFLNEIFKGHSTTHYIVSNQTKDFREKNIQVINVENWNESFDKFLGELVEYKNELTNTIYQDNDSNLEEINIDEIEDVIILESIYQEKIKEVDNIKGKNKELFRELSALKNKILRLTEEKLNFDFQRKIPNHKEQELEYVFDTIFREEKLSNDIKIKIDYIKDQNSEYKWYHRSVVVSALSCSLINHKDVDYSKMDLLIDFTNDSENKVWQKAITHLFLVLNYLGNRWMRFNPLVVKIQRLKKNLVIQEALKEIVYIMQLRLFEISPLSSQIFENDYFKNNTFNYFLPFYEGNSSINKIYEKQDIEDVEDFVDFLYSSPLPSAVKYLFCNSSSASSEKRIINKEEKFFISLMYRVHKKHGTYINNINELLSFYKNSPKGVIAKGLEQNFNIINIEGKGLKKHLLNSIERYRAIARHFMLEENWGQAIVNYEQLLKIKSDDLNALSNIADCYMNTKKRIDKSLEIRKKIESLSPNESENFERIGAIYFYKKKYMKAIEYYDRAIAINSKRALYYNERGITKDALKKYVEAIKDYDKAIEINSQNSSYYFNRGLAKDELKKYSEAIEDYNKAIKLDPKNSSYYFNRSTSIGLLRNYQKALEDCNKAINLDPKKSHFYNYRGIIWTSLKCYEEALTDHNKAISMDPGCGAYYASKSNTLRRMNLLSDAMKTVDIAIEKDTDPGPSYGNKAAIYSALGERIKFYEFLELAFKKKAKAEWLDDDIKKEYKDDERFQELLMKYNQTL
ncbi:SIR2 family protein [uncultured Aquimarina sp.]|uniref:SIR2 family protein n=1 Tax=uncultured Aquimarina sp. TaxID=575652 RepID=UPI0026340FA1|nr:SIR2 family protein [uncultured Aquimarina sp.]